MDVSNEQFWSLIKNGDNQAFQQLYDRYADLLYGYGMKINPDEELVSNAIQSLFVYIFEKRKRLSIPESITAYLCVSLRRVILTELEKQRKTVSVSIDEESMINYNFDLEVDVETSIIRSEYDKAVLDALQTALDGLSKQQREVLYLKYYKGLSNDEIAEIIGTNNQVVRNVSSRALARLRESDALIKAIPLTMLIIYLQLLTY